MKNFLLKYLSFTLLSLLALPVGLSAAVTVKVKAGKLKDANGDTFPVTGLVLVVASTTNDEFTGPDAEAFANGDDVVIDAFDLSGTDTPGLFIETIANYDLAGSLNAGDPVGIYWFPNVTKSQYMANSDPILGDSYGFFTQTSIVSGTAPWVLPPDGGSMTLEFLTEDADFNVFNYTDEAYAQISSAGNAAFTVPEDSGTGGEDPPLDPELFVGDVQLEEGSDWYSNPWLGYYNSLERPWYYHQDLGFVYIPANQTEDSLWMWSAELEDWIWTYDNLWPYAYQLNGGWIYHHSVGGTNYVYRFNGDSMGWN